MTAFCDRKKAVRRNPVDHVTNCCHSLSRFVTVALPAHTSFSPLQYLWSWQRLYNREAETGAPMFQKALSVYVRDSGHIKYLCFADRNLIQAYVQRESNQQSLYSLYSLCSIVHWSFFLICRMCTSLYINTARYLERLEIFSNTSYWARSICHWGKQVNYWGDYFSNHSG